ncbi:MAG: L,D-transpeptidase family protein [Myxococcota bacterium]
MRIPAFALLTAALVADGAWAAPAPRPDDPVFTRFDGLASAGSDLSAWAARARFHGLDLAPDPIVQAYVADRAAGKPYTPAAQQAVEAALEATLERLVAELPAAPRTVPVLNDPDTPFYLSPDVTWRSAPPRTASPETIAAARAAARAGTLDDFLTRLLPPHPQYLRLVLAAERYAELCAAGGWRSVSRPKVLKRRGWRPPPEVAAAFQDRLQREGYYPPAGAVASGVWDDATEAALAAFRSAHQVPQKGIDEDDLIAALNVACEERLATLVTNVKRWRVTAWRGEQTFVEVNLAAQELRYWRDGALVMQQRTIVGSPKWYFDQDLGRRLNVHATPILADAISRIVVNPIWAVPPRIAKNEIDVEVAKDPTWLEKHRMQLVTSPRGRTYIQAAGADNSLGLIKILFPNDEDVYLHDTPKKGAFKLAVRALSHGCVRVQNAVDFGMALLSADAQAAGKPFDEAGLRARTGHGGSIIIDLAAQVPVFLEYYTASVDDAGQVRFHPDIYAYDAELTLPPPKKRAGK